VLLEVACALVQPRGECRVQLCDNVRKTAATLLCFVDEVQQGQAMLNEGVTFSSVQKVLRSAHLQLCSSGFVRSISLE
jgi:hypothetical protein